METLPPFPVDRLSDVQARPHDFRLLERIPLTHESASFPVELNPSSPGDFRFALVDVETTGFQHGKDKIIELGIVIGRFSMEQGRITSITSAHSLYEDPGFPIPTEITELTGITDEMVAGKRIDDAELARIIPPGTLLIAHNAGFDRPFLEDRIVQGGHPDTQRLLNAPWACTLRDIDWKGLGHKSRSLEVLLLGHGYFYTAHRASIDALATSWLLHSNTTALEMLIQSAQAKSFIVRAMGAPFEAKDALKARGYIWNDGSDGGPKHWHTSVQASNLDDELKFLDGLYPNASKRAQLVEQTARTRYKAS